jgi:leucyl-tRNA synthetase
LFAAPPEDQLEWSTGAVEGAWKFISRVVQYAENHYASAFRGALHTKDLGAEEKELNHQLNVAVKKVTEDFSQYKFNTAISALMILLNHAEKYKGSDQALKNKICRTLVLLLAPIVPHICEELWQKIGDGEASVSRAAWPSYDETALAREIIQIVAQVNGKLRGKFDIPADSTEEQIRGIVLADPKIRELIGSKPVRKCIFVPGKLVNLVV